MAAHHLSPRLLLQTISPALLQRLDCFLYQFPVGSSMGYNTPPLCSHSSVESSGPRNTQQCHFTFGKGDAHTNQLFGVWSQQLSVSHCPHWLTGASQQHQHPGVPCHTLVVRDARYGLPCSFPVLDQALVRQLPIPALPTLQVCLYLVVF